MDWKSIIDWIDKFYHQQHVNQDQFEAFWAEHVLFTWRWWFKLAMLVLPWAFWAFVRKKESTYRLLLAGVFVAAFSIFLDKMGTLLGAWYYTAKLLPFLPGSTSYDVATLPVAAMLFIQWFPKVRPVYKALVYAAIGAFVAEPLMVWAGFYVNVHWYYWCTFPVLFVMYLIASWLASRDRFEKIAGT